MLLFQSQGGVERAWDYKSNKKAIKKMLGNVVGKCELIKL
jgi:hypothetical protein